MTYAEGTTVSVERSKMEIDSLLAKHGAGQRAVMADDEKGHAAVAFVVSGAKYRIDIPLPKLDDVRPNGRSIPWPQRWSSKTPSQRDEWVRQRHEQACRERWRAVVLLVKAKMELVRLGISTVAREFLADLVLPNGQTAHQAMGEIIRRGLADGAFKQLGPGDPS